MVTTFTNEKKGIAAEAARLSNLRRTSPSEVALLQERHRVLNTLELHSLHIESFEARMGSLPASAPKSPFQDFGDYVLAVQRAAMMPGRLDPRLTTRAAGMSENLPSDGGFLVPSEFSTELLRRSLYEATLAPLVRHRPITKGNEMHLPIIDERSHANGSRWGGVSSAWLNESDLIPTSKPKVASLDLVLQKIGVAIYATDELMQDAPALGAFVMQAAAEEFAFKLDDAIVNGNGVGKPLGFLNSPALITVAKDSGQAGGTITPSNITNMWGRMLARSKRRAVWAVSEELESALYSTPLVVGAAGSQFNLFTQPDADAPWGRLMSRPIIPMEQLPVIGTVGDIVLLDPQEYLLVDREMRSDVSIHVKFLTGEGVFRFIYRVDGQPIMPNVIQPFQGSTTRSASVTLAARP